MKKIFYLISIVLLLIVSCVLIIINALNVIDFNNIDFKGVIFIISIALFIVGIASLFFKIKKLHHWLYTNAGVSTTEFLSTNIEKTTENKSYRTLKISSIVLFASSTILQLIICLI